MSGSLLSHLVALLLLSACGAWLAPAPVKTSLTRLHVQSKLERWANRNSGHSYGGGGGYGGNYHDMYQRDNGYDSYSMNRGYDSYDSHDSQYVGYNDRRGGGSYGRDNRYGARSFRPDNGKTWNDSSHWLNDNRKSSNRDDMIGPRSSSSRRRYGSSPSSSGWPSRFDASRSSGRGSYTSNNNRWNPSSYARQHDDFDYDRIHRQSSNYGNSQHWSPRSSSYGRLSSNYGRARRAEYESGVSGPISSEGFQKGIKNHVTIGPEPHYDRQRRMRNERQYMPFEDSHFDMSGRNMENNNEYGYGSSASSSHNDYHQGSYDNSYDNSYQGSYENSYQGASRY